MSAPRGGYRRRPGSAPARSARDTVLAEWRGVDLGPLEKARRLAARSVADILPEVQRSLNLDRRRSEAEIARAWNALMDPTVGAHAHPTGLHQGTLFLTVDSHVWLDEIVRFRRKEILDRLQQSFGKDRIRRLSFRVG